MMSGSHAGSRSRTGAWPAVLFPLAFMCLISVGTLLLKLPWATAAGQSLSWLDALFTMTSVVCVTGLTVRCTTTQFTAFGQSLIALFIQVGGLVIMTFGFLVAMQFDLRQPTTGARPQRPYRIVLGIVLATIGLDLFGAVALFLCESPRMVTPSPGPGAWAGVSSTPSVHSATPASI